MEEFNATTRWWREVRKASKLSQPQFAEVLETTQASISMIETGKTKNPSVDMVNKLFKAFPDLSKVWFFDGVGPMYSPKKKSRVDEILDGEDILALPEIYRYEPVMKEYFERIRALVAMQQDKINTLEIDKAALEEDKRFLQSMLKGKMDPVG